MSFNTETLLPMVAPLATPAPAPVTVATPAPVKAKAASMAAIRKDAPEFFTVNLADSLLSLSDKGARIAALSMALAGAAIERAQSGNMPNAWSHAMEAAAQLKGQTKARALAACAHIEGIKPGSIKAADTAAFSDFGYEVAAIVSNLLTPATTAKRESNRTDWKAECLAAQAQRDALALEVAALRDVLKAAGVKAPKSVNVSDHVGEPATV